MRVRRFVSELELVKLSKRARTKAGISKAEAAKAMRVSYVSIHHAEEDPKQSLTRLRRRIVERYSPYKVVGPVFLLKRKPRHR